MIESIPISLLPQDPEIPSQRGGGREGRAEHGLSHVTGSPFRARLSVTVPCTPPLLNRSCHVLRDSSAPTRNARSPPATGWAKGPGTAPHQSPSHAGQLLLCSGDSRCSGAATYGASALQQYEFRNTYGPSHPKPAFSQTSHPQPTCFEETARAFSTRTPLSGTKRAVALSLPYLFPRPGGKEPGGNNQEDAYR